MIDIERQIYCFFTSYGVSCYYCICIMISPAVLQWQAHLLLHVHVILKKILKIVLRTHSFIQNLLHFSRSLTCYKFRFCFSFYCLVCFSVCLFAYLFVCLFACLFVRPSICLFILFFARYFVRSFICSPVCVLVCTFH